MNIGLEIELYFKDELLDVLDYFRNKYKNFKFTLDYKYSSITELVFKTDPTIKGGIEINIPPCLFNSLEDILNDVNKFNPYYSGNCCLHIHVGAENINIGKLYNYYKDNETEILDFAVNNGLTDKTHINLNKSIQEKVLKYQHMNIWQAYMNHNTVEHRIYKATTDYNKIKQCIDQTINIIKQAGEQ